MTGQIHKMTDAEYFADPALNHSSLKWLIEATPAHFRYRMDNPHHEPTADMEFGSAVHSLVLGGDEIFQVAAPTWQKKADQEFRKEARAAGRVALLTADYERAQRCADAVAQHPLAGNLLANTDHREVVLKWDDDGVILKAKLDGISGQFVWDLKTTGNASTDAFGRSSAKYGYVTQATVYTDAAIAIGMDDPKFLLVAVEKEEPHLVHIMDFDPEDLVRGRAIYRKALDLYRQCVEADDWPGYGSEIGRVVMPRWWQIATEDQYDEEELVASW